MANKPKVSSITVKVKRVNPDFEIPTNPKVSVFMELQKGSEICTSDKFVLYLFPQGEGSKTLEYPQGRGECLTNGKLVENTERTYFFDSEYEFLSPINGEYPYNFQKMTINVPEADKPEERWQLIDFPDSRDNFSIEVASGSL